MPDDLPGERLNRALRAYLRQELQAPATAITEFLDIIIEDARAGNVDHVLPDLTRMRTASVQLNAFVQSLLQDTSFNRHYYDESFEGFHRRLRHDLRTPLNAIKGYSEMLVEDMQEDGEHFLLHDLKKLKQAADELLGQVDSMVALGRPEDSGPSDLSSHQQQLDFVAGVLRAVQPLAADQSRQSLSQSSQILVVDDNPSNRDILARRLMREGHQVETVESGPAALELTLSRAFDLILLDLIMPEMSGFEVLRRLKSAQHTSHVPVIVISALDELDSVVRCIEAGAEDFLTKPFDPILLRARIGACIEKKWLRDREKKFVEELDLERRRSDALLLNILPQSIITRMRRGEMSIADRFTEATILFCDLVGFTVISQDLPADRTVDFLGQIFSIFDRLAAEHGVEKIKTIGDAYMAAAGIPDPQPDHALRVAELAPRMLDAVQAIGKATKLELQARIGIHTGAVVAGVIGTHKFIYDVWGDTVNTASRMESYSLPGRIHVSAATRLALGNRFKFEPRGPLQIKGKGIMETHFLLDDADQRPAVW